MVKNFDWKMKASDVTGIWLVIVFHIFCSSPLCGASEHSGNVYFVSSDIHVF